MEEYNNSSERVCDLAQELFDASVKNKVLILNLQTLKKYVLYPKEYSVVALFPVSAKEVHDAVDWLGEFYRVVKLFRHSAVYKKKLFFAVIDFQDKDNIFKLLNLKPSYSMIHFPPSGTLRKGDVFHLADHVSCIKDIKEWIEWRTVILTNPHPIVLVMYALPDVLQKLLFRIFNKESLAAGSIAFTLLMMSGNRWVEEHMNYKLYYENDEEYISRDLNEQFFWEGYIVIALLVVSIGGMIILIEAAAFQKSLLKTFLLFLGVSLFYIFFSLIIVVYRKKHQRYPLTLLFS